MKIVSWNVNGLRSIISKGLNAYLATEKADVYCFQEIKSLSDQLGDWAPPAGYSVFWNSAQRKGYAGTLILSRMPVLDCFSGGVEPVGDAEGRCQTLEFNSFFLVNVYTPNAKGDLSRLAYRTNVWDPAFRNHCLRLQQRKPVVFCGDLNVAHNEIDLANPKTNRRNAGFTDEERAAFSAHLQAGFVDSFRHLFPDLPKQYSWWSYRAGARSRNVGWRIDYVCTSQTLSDRIADAFIRHEVPGSDHCPVGISLAI